MLSLRFAFAPLLMFALIAVSSATAEDLELVQDESRIEFVGSKPDGKHEGGFKKFDVDAQANFEDPSKSSLAVKIDANSLWSDNDRLTNHLKSPDFFDVRKYPTITFKSTKIEPGEKEGDAAKATITGDWTMLGKTVEVEIPIVAVVSEEAVIMEADFTIDRTKWGMTYGQGKVNNEVKVTARFAFER